MKACPVSWSVGSYRCVHPQRGRWNVYISKNAKVFSLGRPLGFLLNTLPHTALLSKHKSVAEGERTFRTKTIKMHYYSFSPICLAYPPSHWEMLDETWPQRLPDTTAAASQNLCPA